MTRYLWATTAILDPAANLRSFWWCGCHIGLFYWSGHYLSRCNIALDADPRVGHISTPSVQIGGPHILGPPRECLRVIGRLIA